MLSPSCGFQQVSSVRGSMAGAPGVGSLEDVPMVGRQEYREGSDGVILWRWSPGWRPLDLVPYSGST
jgi:hypothetical protein